MSAKNIIWRVSSILVLFAMGAWAFFGNGGPAAETAARERAVLSLSGAENVGNGQPGASRWVVEPVFVNLADVVNVPGPSQYDRWLAGEIDLDESEYRVGPAQRAELREESKKRSEGVTKMQLDAADDTPDLNTPTIGLSFAALDVTVCCGGSTSVPPDSDLAVGADYVIAVENSSFGIYSKSTGTLTAGPILFNSFLGATGTFDPTALYDSEEDRYVMGIEDGEFFYLMVSPAGTPLGSWGIYSFDAQYYGDEFFDYPHIGIGDHAIFMGSNMFNGSIPLSFEGRLYAMDKNAAYAGSPMTVVSYSAGYDGSTPQPLNLNGYAQDSVPVPFNTHYFVTDYYDGSTVWLWAWSNPFTGGVPTVVQTYNLGAQGLPTGYPVDSPQLGSADLIAGNDWRLRSFEYRNGYAYIADTVSYNWGSGDNDVLRWFKINLGAAGYPFVDGGGFGADGYNYIFPDINANMCDDIAIGYERAGSAINPEVRLTGRLSTTSGSLGTSVTVKAGETTYFSFDGSPLRWGDYSGMAIDPDGATFWQMGEYAKTVAPGPAANYGNWIAASNYSSCYLRSFVDVHPSVSTWPYIESIYDAGITGGCTNGPRKYCPTNTVTRGQMAVFLLRGIHGGSYTPPAATGTMFTDVPIGHSYAAWIEQFATEGITSGCGGGNYCPSATITRGQMAVFLLRAEHGSGYTPPAATGTMFADVPIGHPQAAWIEQLANEGISTGCGGGNFCPGSAVTRAQMAVFIQKTFGLTLPPFP